MARVKVGVIGCGVMGSNHIKIASTHPDAKLIGIFDLDENRLKEVSARFGGTPYPTMEQLINNCEALIIASPTFTHFEVSRQALSMGKHLLVEKPLTMDSTQGEELVSLANSKGLALAVGMIERFNPAFTKAFQLTKKEKILGIEIKRFSPFPERISDASVIWDVMIHDLDLALLLGKVEVESIKASGKKVKTDKIDEADATLYFKDGTIAKVMASRVKNEKVRMVQITTEHAIYDADLLNKKAYKRSFDTLVERQEIETQPADQLTLEQKDFYAAITRKRRPNSSGEDALKVVKLAEEVERKCL